MLLITIPAPRCESALRYQSIASILWEKMVAVNAEGGVDNSSVQPTVF